MLDRFPYKLVIHTLLIIFTTVQLMQLADTASTYKKPIMDVYKYLLTVRTIAVPSLIHLAIKNSTDPDFTTQFYTVSDFQGHLISLTDVLTLQYSCGMTF